MKKYLILLAACSLLAGCVQPNTDKTPGAPAYVPNTNQIQSVGNTVSGYIDKAQAANAMSAPINPYAAPVAAGLETVKTVALGVTTLATMISGLIAFVKSKTAGTRKAALVTLSRHDTNEEAILNANSPEEASELAIAHQAATPISQPK